MQAEIDYYMKVCYEKTYCLLKSCLPSWEERLFSQCGLGKCVAWDLNNEKNPQKVNTSVQKKVTHMFVPETSFLKPYKFSYICNRANLNLWSVNSFFSAGKPALPSNSELASIFLNKYVRNQMKERKEELRQALRSIS